MMEKEPQSLKARTDKEREEKRMEEKLNAQLVLVL